MIDRVPAGRAVLDGVPVDPAAVTLSWTDPAAQWGLGIFETIAVREGRAEQWDAHHARLEGAAGRVGVPLPARPDLDRAARAVGGSVPDGHGWLKILVSRSGRWAVIGGPSDRAAEGRPVSVIILPWRRHHRDVLAGIKSLAYASSILGLEEARKHGADEGLFLNERGHVIEACTANVFAIRGRAAVTPPIGDGARDGVTRARAVEALRALGFSVRQSKLRILALRSADEVFLTSSLHGIRPVVRIDGRALSKGAPGAATLRLAERLAAQEVEDHA